MAIIENPLSNTDVAACSDLAVKVNEAITQAQLTDEYLKVLSTSLGEKGQQMVSSIATDRSRAKTEELQQADAARDSLFAALKYFLRGYMTWNKDDYPKYAEKLMDIVKQHGLNLHRESYQKQSALTISLLKDFSELEATNMLTKLNLTTLIAELNEAEIHFDKLQLEAAETQGNKEEVVAATTIKKEVLTNLSNIADYLNTMQKVNSAAYGSLANTVAELINSSNRKVRNKA